MRVIVATRVFEPEPAAAAYRLGALVHALDQAGHQVTVLTTRAPGANRSSRRIRRWPVIRNKNGVVRGYVSYLSFDIPLFFRLLFRRRFDVVVVEPPPTTGFITRVACAIRRRPYVYYSADVLTSALSGLKVSRLVKRTVKFLEQSTLKGAVGALAVSRAVADAVIELGAHQDTVANVGTGIDTERFSATGSIVSSHAPYFVYAGTMSEVHGAQVFVEAFRLIAGKNPDARLHIFGSGTDESRLRLAASEVSDQVTFARSIEAAELAPWLRGAVAGLASVRPGAGYDFAIATKALASLACGTPVIYAGAGPLAEVVTSAQLGWAVRWDALHVASAMESAIARYPSRPDERLSHWVRDHYSMDAVANRAVTAIEQWTTASARQSSAEAPRRDPRRESGL